MAMLLGSRTISMILTVPEVKELTTTLSQSVDELHDGSLPVSKIHKPPSIPIYHGSIVSIEQHEENENLADLIVRVPNYQHGSSSVTITAYPSNIDQFNAMVTQRETSFKRRAPICPILNQPKTDSVNENPSEAHIPSTNTKHLAIGLRNLSQVFANSCKSKRATDVNQIAIIPVLPDVEIITENFQISSPRKKTLKSRKADFLTPKILFIKRKCLQIKKKHVASSKTDSENNITNASQTEIPPKDGKTEQTTPSPSPPNIPIILIDADSSSAHPYNTLDSDAKDIFQTDTFIITDPINPSSPSIPNEENPDETVYVVHPNGDAYSECYEVTYQFDPEFQQYLDHKSKTVSFPENQDLPYPTINRVPNLSDDIEESSAHIYEEQPTTDQLELAKSELDEIPYVNEDYTIIIELLKNILQMNITTNTTDDGTIVDQDQLRETA
ncbi:unnamed protein product [Adineta ricciae]|uniref:Uncharacterized protein n=1 Tax=Adineta ricciae TaxID=249248 RepID=A0A814VYA8_ADIRI|nr:unnamed protein product [Adineta ricciae]